MVALLGKIRKQMNGAVLDTFRYYGAKYGLNYGVAIHSIRDMASECGTDHSLALHLYRQQVRELQIIALWVADPAAVTDEELTFWRGGIINSELAEQAAQALLCRVSQIDTLLMQWTASDNELAAYAALLAATRSSSASDNSIRTAISQVVAQFADNHLVALGVTNLLASRIATNRNLVESALDALPENKTAASIRDEVSWQLDILS